MGYVTREMIDRAKEMDLLTYLQTYDWPGENAMFSPSLYLAAANTASFTEAEVNQRDQ